MKDEHGSETPGLRAKRRTYVIALLIAVLPYSVIPVLGSQFYFRHDDAALILWAKEFTHPLHHMFSPDPAVNHFNDYPGMAGAWRPFNTLYIKILWHLYGANPAPYQIIGGLIFILAIALLFALAARENGVHPALIGCLALFAAFHSTMYNLFHIAAPISYLIPLAMIYCSWQYLRRGRWYFAAGMILLLGPSMGRQTTAIVLTAILIITTWERARWKPFPWGRTLFTGMVIGAQIFLGTLNQNVGYGSVISIFPDYAGMLAFVHERYIYYGTLLTSGMTGLIVLTIFTAGTLHHISRRFDRIAKRASTRWLYLPVTLFAVPVLLHVRPLAIYWLTASIVYLFLFESDVRLLLGWSGASMLSYLCVFYYHNGYLLEAAFPLSLVIGILTVRVGKSIGAGLERMHVPSAKAAAAGVCVLVAGAAAVAVAGGRIPFVRKRVELIRVSIDSNRNFDSLMRHLADELPENAVVFELDEEQLGTTSMDRRFLPLHKRASIIKVMNIRDQLVMLRVLDREDIRILPAVDIGAAGAERGAYFIALNDFERNRAEALYDLDVVREFGGGADSAAVYTFSGGFD